jgi:glycosyltransferase involved in cell wall biosynthesis
LSTQGYFTDPSIKWNEFCSITPEGDARAFAEKAQELISNPKNLIKMGTAGLKKYESTFSWPVITQQLVNSMRGSS